MIDMAKRIKSLFIALFVIGLIVLAVSTVVQPWNDCRAAGGEPFSTRQGRTIVQGCRFPSK